MKRILLSVWLTSCVLSVCGPLSCDPHGAAVGEELRRTYFVDSESGRDSWDGQAPDRAWRSLDRVNAAELQPGDAVRFKCGGVWRGCLVPVSGDQDAPITYTSFGEGPKPQFLGSVARNRPEDWVKVGENLWATLPMEYRLGDQLLDLRTATWSRHQEAGANVEVTHADDPAGRIVHLVSNGSGAASNHVQLWGPVLRVEKDACLVLTFRAGARRPFVSRASAFSSAAHHTRGLLRRGLSPPL